MLSSVRSGIMMKVTKLALLMACSFASQILPAFVGVDVVKQYTLTAYQVLSWPVSTVPQPLAEGVMISLSFFLLEALRG